MHYLIDDMQYTSRPVVSIATKQLSGKKLDSFGDRDAVFFWTRSSLGLRKEGSSTFCNGEELFCCRLHEPIGEGVWNQFFSLSS